MDTMKGSASGAASLGAMFVLAAAEAAVNAALAAGPRGRLQPFAGRRVAIEASGLRWVATIVEGGGVRLSRAAADVADASLIGDEVAVAGYLLGLPEGAGATASGDTALLAACVACAADLPDSLVAPLAPLLGVEVSSLLVAGMRAGGAAAVSSARRITDMAPDLAAAVARMAGQGRD